MSSRKSKIASDGTKTECGKEVRGAKGLAAHVKVCTGRQSTRK